MARDFTKLRVFELGHQLALDVYALTQEMPASEAFGLRQQLRRAAVSVPTNIVEGCARSSLRDHLRFLDIAAASATELRYLLDLAADLDLLRANPVPCREQADHVIRALHKLRASLDRLDSAGERNQAADPSAAAADG